MKTRALLAAITFAGLLLAEEAHPGILLNDCAWLEFTTYPGISNVPDNVNTRIYQAFYSASPGHETVIRGSVPSARFWSFAALDQTTAEVAGLSDDQIETSSGNYEIHVKLECGSMESNCLAVGTAQVPLAGRLFYRLYVPDGERGGVPLPTVEYRAIDDPTPPTVVPLDGETCAAGTLGVSEPLRADGPVGGELAQSTGLEGSVSQPGAAPEVRRFDGLAGGQFQRVEQQLADLGAPPEVNQAIEENRKKAGGGATADNGYVTVTFNIRSGNLHLRAKAPTFRKQHDTPTAELIGRSDGSEQTRYWSLCTTQETRPVDCVKDEDVVIDPATGFFDVIVAPTCPQDGYANCLRAGITGATGAGAVNILLYRNLLASESFANEKGPDAAECAEKPESQFCGDYALQAHYVTR